jgi:hypothetical protein
MALDTYANLKSSIRDWSHRNDMTNARINDYIGLAETAMWQLLELRDMSTRTTLTTDGDRFLDLPDGFIKFRRVSALVGGRVDDIKYASPESMRVINTSGQPRFFTVTSEFEFDRTPDTNYSIEVVYFKELTPLSDSSPTNAVLTRFPDIYLSGALHYLFQFGNFSEESQRYLVQFSDAIKRANKQDRKGRYGPAMAGRKEGATP